MIGSCCALTAVLACLIAAASPAVARGAPSATGDFDGDGRSDLAIGAPMDSVTGRANAGAVNVIYGSRRGGLSEDADQQFTQATPGIKGVPEPHDRFGSALTAGDFDGDGRSDLAIGSPGEDASGRRNAGAVHVLRGGRNGLTTADELLAQGYAGVPGAAEPEQNLGAALAAGDFDDDGRDDLAVGVPDDTVADAPAAGAVLVLYPARGGVAAGRDQIWTQDSRSVRGLAAPYHRFGHALAAGDLDGDGDDDLAIGIPGGRIDGRMGAGAVTVLYSARGRLRAGHDQLWSQGARGIKGAPEASDGFGWSLAIGDFDQDRAMDLAAGAPFESVGGADDAGAVSVLYGTRRGLRGADELFDQDSRGVKGRAEAGDRLGLALAAGDFDGDGEDDLAIGVPREGRRGLDDSGSVAVLYGSEANGITPRDDLWDQGSRGIKGRPQAFDLFGLDVGTGDFDGDGRWDLVAAAPHDSVQGYQDAGAVNVIYGDRGGLREDPDELWTQGTRGIKGAVGDDRFGLALASGAPGR